MQNNRIDQEVIETEIFNLIVGHEDNESNNKKKQRSKRMFAARRAIEKYRETKQLAEYVDEIWGSGGES